ncbi:glycosyltransferase family 4 protein [Flavobacterium sp. GB2R13]|uniref:glycosyltransferase family 4 protein n=1 Tax=Flavobacterium algoris TaxID=3398733 RepID=UPI003A87B9B3
MSDKKLIYILNHYSENSSQHFFHVLNLLEEIAQNGVNINLIIEKTEGKPIVNNSNIKVFCLKKIGIYRLFELYGLISQMQREGYNKLFVRITNWGAIMAILNSFISKLEVYYWHSGTVFEFDNEQKFSLDKVKWYLKTRLPFNFIKRFVTFFVTGPESMREYYVNMVGISDDKIKVLYNDIDTSRFYKVEKQKSETIKNELGIASDKKIILFVHKFSPVRKSKLYVSNFIKQFYNESLLQSYLFYFIGDGKDKDDIEKEVKAMGYEDKVFFLGSLPNAIVHQFYQIADIFINPTHAEGFPRVLIEAMACGLPIVTTNAGGIKDILGEKQLDFMSDINDSNGFAINLVKLAKLESSELNLIRDENLEEIKKYSTQKVALMYIKTIFNE